VPLTGVVIGERQLARRLVHEHLGEVTQRGAEVGVVGPLVAHAGETGLGQRVVDDGQLHGRHRIGLGVFAPARSAQWSLSAADGDHCADLADLARPGEALPGR